MSDIIWREIKLKELINDISDGATPSTTDESNFGKGIPWVVVEDILPEIWKTQQELTEKGFGNCSAKKWQPGTVILSTGATIGKVGIAKVELCTKQGITGIVCNVYLIPEFLKYWFEQNTNQLLKYSQGTTIKEIRSRAIKNFHLCLPNPLTKDSISIQQVVVNLLTTLDITILNINISIEKAERLRKSLMQNLLTGKLKSDGTWRKENEYKMDDKIGLYPKDWQIGKLKNFIELQRGIDLTNDNVKPGIYPVVKSNGIDCYHNEYKVKAPGVVTGRSGTIGNVFFIEEDFWPHNTSLYVKDFKGNYEKFIYYLIRYLKFDRYYAGTSVPTLNRNDVHKIKIAIPHPDEQKYISGILDEIQTAITLKQNKMLKVEMLKKSLLQNLLTGKVKIKPI